MSEIITLANVRIAFAQGIFTAKAFNDGDGPAKYSCNFILDDDDPQVARLSKAITKKIKDELKGVHIQESKLCLQDGINKGEYEGFGEGTMFVSCSEKTRPTVMARDGKTPVAEADGLIYSGCYVNAQISLWAQNNQWGKRINANLVAVQYIREGEAFGGRSESFSEGSFEDLTEEEVEESEEFDALA